MIERVYSAHEAATRVGVTERTVRRWIDRGWLPAHKRGRAYEIKESDLLQAKARSGSRDRPGISEALHDLEQLQAKLTEEARTHGATKLEAQALRNALESLGRRGKSLSRLIPTAGQTGPNPK
jgi:excisionase family DNA binding protein